MIDAYEIMDEVGLTQTAELLAIPLQAVLNVNDEEEKDSEDPN
jgi:hypothetical protein